MGSILTQICFILTCSSVLAADGPAVLLKPIGKAYKHTGLQRKYAKQHPDFITYSLHRFLRWDPLPKDQQNYEPSFEKMAVIGLDCEDRSKGRNADETINGAIVKEASRPGELVVEVDTTISTRKEVSAAEQSKYRKEMRERAADNDRIKGIVGDVQTGSGLSLTQDSALRRQAASIDLSQETIVKTEKRQYTLRGFDSTRIKVGDKITFSGIFAVKTENGVKVIEPYRESSALAADSEPTVSPENGPIFLSDLNEESFEAWTQGSTGFGKGQIWDTNGWNPIVISGKRSPNGLATHPPHRGNAVVRYKVGRLEAKNFQASVGVADLRKSHPASALTFKVYGDGKLLWASRPITKLGQVEEVEVPMAGVELLELVVECPGRADIAFAAWGEPRLTR